MIYYLDIILVFNIILAFKYFKNLIAPPILVGVGMLGASIIASTYYEEWQLSTMMAQSVFILGCGPLLFTFLCIIINQIGQRNEFRAINTNVSYGTFNLKRLLVFYVFFDIFVLFIILSKYIIMRNTFGVYLTFSELIFSNRMDTWSGDNMLQFPKYVTYGSTFSLLVSFYTYYLLSLSLLSKSRHLPLMLSVLLWIHFSLLIVNGMLGGDKGSVLEPLFRFVTVFLFVYYTFNHSFKMKKKTFVRMALIFLVVALSFRSLSGLMGRETDSYSSNTDMLAEYMGGEIKNFDIYMHHMDGNPKDKVFGEKTFASLYEDLDSKYVGRNGNFQSVGNYSLGNVYTQYYYWFDDWGYVGIIFMSLLIAITSMFFYKRSWLKISQGIMPNPAMFIFVMMVSPLFMSFFSSKFTEAVIRTSFLKLVIYIFVFNYIFIKLFKTQQRNVTGSKNIGMLP